MLCRDSFFIVHNGNDSSAPTLVGGGKGARRSGVAARGFGDLGGAAGLAARGRGAAEQRMRRKKWGWGSACLAAEVHP